MCYKQTSARSGSTAARVEAALQHFCNAASAVASGSYCQELKADKAYFQSLDGTEPDLTRLDDVFGRMHSLAAAAPADVASDWSTLDTMVSNIEAALADAGLKPDDLATMQKGQLPEGVNLDKVAALTPKMRALSGKKATAAVNHIVQGAKTSCSLDLTAR